VATDCPSTGTLCVVNSCVEGCCVTQDAYADSYCEGGGVCDGNGHCVGCIGDGDCSFLNKGGLAPRYACDVNGHSCVIAYGGTDGYPCNNDDQCRSTSCGTSRGSGGARCCQSTTWIQGQCGSIGCNATGYDVFTAAGTPCSTGVCNGQGVCSQ
jgi:hypothetical protein